MGGALTGKSVKGLLRNVNSSVVRVAGEFGVRMAGEGIEEGLQELVEPLFRNALYGENNKLSDYTEDALYAALLGALAVGPMEGPNIISVSNRGRAVKKSGHYQGLLSRALLMDENTQTHKLAKELAEGLAKPNNTAVGELMQAYIADGGETAFLTEIPARKTTRAEESGEVEALREAAYAAQEQRAAKEQDARALRQAERAKVGSEQAISRSEEHTSELQSPD